MSSSRVRKAQSLAVQTAELAAAVPQVMAHRVTRMALAGAMPSERDRKEFKLMSDEKTAAFAESWVAMSTQAVVASQALGLSMFRSMWAPALGRKPSVGALSAQMQNAALGVLGKGMAPVHRKAVANAKRLARTKLR